AMAGPDPRVPTAISESGRIFLSPLKRSFKKTRIAWSRNLGGLPVEPQIVDALEKQRAVFKKLGCVIEEAEPDFSGATEAFETLRAVGFATKLGPVMRDHRNKLKGTVIWNVEQGLKLTGEQIARAETLRSALFHRMRGFL